MGNDCFCITYESSCEGLFYDGIYFFFFFLALSHSNSLLCPAGDRVRKQMDRDLSDSWSEPNAVVISSSYCF